MRKVNLNIRSRVPLAIHFLTVSLSPLPCDISIEILPKSLSRFGRACICRVIITHTFCPFWRVCLSLTHTKTTFHCRMTDDNVSYQQTAENLKLKLSLKKQIWTGTICALSQQPLEKIYQPLSWGVPPLVRKKQPKYDENEELLT